jgi:hypothetical protein
VRRVSVKAGKWLVRKGSQRRGGDACLICAGEERARERDVEIDLDRRSME